MGREEIVGAAAGEWVDDEKMSHGWIALGVHVHTLAGVGFDLPQGAGERFGIAADLSADAVGFIFARG